MTSLQRVVCAIALLALAGALPIPVTARTTILPPQPPLRPDPVVAGRVKVRVTRDAATREPMEKILSRYGLHVAYEILPYRRSLTYRQAQSVRDGNGVNHADALRLEDLLLRTVVATYEGTADPERMIAWLRVGCSDIEVAEPVVVSSIQAQPNDPQITEQKMLGVMNVFEAWDVEQGSDSILIGISDSGILQTHEDLVDAIHVNMKELPGNGIDDDRNGYIDDYNGYNFCTKDDGSAYGNTYNSREGHGTGVAGICGATVNNGIGIAGIANKCKIVPLKTMPDDEGGIIYGYESVMYCALNGIDIVNCSWGSFSKSCIDQDVISYAIALGTAVIAAAGNHGTTAFFYPAAYDGVLSVGVTNPDDDLVGMSARGSFVDVMAPGQDTRTTSNDGTYGSFCCTSGSAPIVSGMVGLIRSRWPELGPLQACALARIAVDDILVRNPQADGLIPGRINVLKAVTIRPDSTPSFELVAGPVSVASGAERWGLGDVIDVGSTIRNHLASCTDVTVIADVIGPAGSAIQLQDADQTVGNIASGDSVAMPASVTRVRIMGDTDELAFVRYRLSGRTAAGAPHEQTLLVPVTPAPAYSTLHNDVLALSVGDRCRIGNTDIDRTQGAGVRYRKFCGQLYEGGLMVSTRQRVVDAIRDVRKTNNHFVPMKRFVGNDPMFGVARDNDAPDSLRLGVEISQRVRLAPSDSALFTSDITVRNVTDSVLEDVGIGWFFDWDLGMQPARNRTMRIDAYTQVAMSTDPGGPVVVCRVIPLGTTGEPVVAGLNNTSTYDGFPASRKISLLHPGAPVDYREQNDIACITGVRYRSGLQPGALERFVQIIAIDTTLERALALAGTQPVPEEVGSTLGTPYPNPAMNIVHIPVLGFLREPASFVMYDAQGREAYRHELAEGLSEEAALSFDTSVVASGIYVCVLTHSGLRSVQTLVVVR